jgi:Ni/Fe-hydrogenase b-type cytochrome subunit
MASLVYRHNRVTRLTHWVNFVALTILLMSGLQIFNAHPHLYWGNSSDPGTAFFSISATGPPANQRGYVELLGLRIDTTGLLGLQYTQTGINKQAFPGWLTIPSYYWLAGGRHWHFFFAWLFVINGALYLVYNLLNGHIRKFFLMPRDAAKIPAMTLYYLHLRNDSPQEGEYNPLQKMAYTGVFLVLVPLVILSGLAMSPQLNQAFNWLPAVFGGRQSARTIHFILTFAFIGFVVGHIFMVLTTGVINNMRSIISGWYSEKLHFAGTPAPVDMIETPVEAPAPVAPGQPIGAENAESPEQESREPDAAPAKNGEPAVDAEKMGGEKNASK